MQCVIITTSLSLSPLLNPHWSDRYTYPPTHCTVAPIHPHQEVATYIGRVVCDGEGHLNASSCLLEGPVRSRALYSHRVRLEIPEATQCCLFPGQVGRTTCDSILSLPLSPHPPSLLTQVVAVEGINNYSGSLIPNVIYDQVLRSPSCKLIIKGVYSCHLPQGVFPPLPQRPKSTVGGVSTRPTLWLTMTILCLQGSHC